VLYYLAENFSAREAELTELLATHMKASTKSAREEVRFCTRRLFHYAALADKMDGRVHSTVGQHVTLAMNEPWGVLGILCPDTSPLAGLVGLSAPALAFGNRVVAITSQSHALAALEFQHLLESSDMPPGAMNLVSGDRAALAAVLAGHDDVDSMWAITDAEGLRKIETLSIGNLKPVWSPPRDAWQDPGMGSSEDELARRTLQVKNIWVPYGESTL
jgi:aldehyde dehydrogenase (NAD+)